jgi:hypothetical protein
MTTYKSILAIFILPTNPKVIAVVNTILSAINLIFLPFTITLVVIVLYSEVSNTYKYW